jgi:homoserine kinase
LPKALFHTNFTALNQGIKAFGPASIGNVAVGFDILGLCLDKPGDEVIARKSTQPGVRITKITGHHGRLPYETEKNTAGKAVLSLLEAVDRTNEGIDLEVLKKLPLGSGMGSSAASAVAAVFAVNELLKLGLTKRELLPHAVAGEEVASKSRHADNVAPSLLGGIILCVDHHTLDVQRLYIPRGLQVVVVHPNIEILTSEARAILSQQVPLSAMIQQTANLGGLIMGFTNSDFGLIGRSLRDVVIEPQRSKLIPGFYDVQEAAMSNGALGCSISGAGPSMFALFSGTLQAEEAAIAMQKAWKKHKIDSTIYLSGVNQEGAKLF